MGQYQKNLHHMEMYNINVNFRYYAVIPQLYVSLYIGLDGEVHTLQENSGN